MKRHHLAHALLVAASAFVLAPFAAADGIVKCIGAEGRVTLTDTACQAGERSVTVVPGTAVSAPQEAAPAAYGRSPTSVTSRIVQMSSPPVLSR